MVTIILVVHWLYPAELPWKYSPFWFFAKINSIVSKWFLTMCLAGANFRIHTQPFTTLALMFQKARNKKSWKSRRVKHVMKSACNGSIQRLWSLAWNNVLWRPMAPYFSLFPLLVPSLRFVEINLFSFFIVNHLK